MNMVNRLVSTNMVYFYQQVRLSSIVYPWMLYLFEVSVRNDLDHLRVSYRIDEPLIAAIIDPTVLISIHRSMLMVTDTY